MREWMDREKPGRKPLDDDKKRYQIRPTVSYESREWLEAQSQPVGRTIDKLIAIYQMRVKP